MSPVCSPSGGAFLMWPSVKRILSVPLFSNPQRRAHRFVLADFFVCSLVSTLSDGLTDWRLNLMPHVIATTMQELKKLPL